MQMAVMDKALKAQLTEAANKFGTPLYVYDLRRVRARAAALTDLFEGLFQISYALKANPNLALVEGMKGHVPYLDVSSIGEMHQGIAAGFAPATISFTGPAKRDEELRESIALGLGHLVVESVDEAITANAIAQDLGRTQAVLVRLSPNDVPKGFGLNMSGRPTQFGIDEDEAVDATRKIMSLGNLTVEGLHIYSGTQCLKADAVAENHALMAALFEKVCEAVDLTPKHLVFGGGMGVPVHAGEQPLDEAAVAAQDVPMLRALKAKPRFAATVCALEIGRALVAEAGWFVTSVVRVKESRGTRIALCDGGLNNHLAATGNFGAAIRRNFRLSAISQSNDVGEQDIVGPLCTTIDLLGQKVELPLVSAGDLVVIEASGAYGFTASPTRFISHPQPQEVLWDGDKFVEGSA